MKQLGKHMTLCCYCLLTNINSSSNDLVISAVCGSRQLLGSLSRSWASMHHTVHTNTNIALTQRLWYGLTVLFCCIKQVGSCYSRNLKSCTQCAATSQWSDQINLENPCWLSNLLLLVYTSGSSHGQRGMCRPPFEHTSEINDDRLCYLK